jgi:hypothetical protein
MAGRARRTDKADLGARRDGGAPGDEAGPVRAAPSERGQGELSQHGVVTRPGRPAAVAAAAIVHVLVDHVTGGTEQMHELEREMVRWNRGGGVHFSLASAWCAARCEPAPIYLPLPSMLARQAPDVCVASAQPEFGLPGLPHSS